MLEKMPEKKCIDRFNDYFPKTMDQSKRAVIGFLGHNKVTHQRTACFKGFLLHYLTIPVVIPALITWNFAQTCKHVALLGLNTTKLPFHFSQRKGLWQKMALRSVDYGMATLLSPLNPLAKSARYFLGAIKPSTFFGSEQKLLLNDRLDVFAYQDKAYLEMKKNASIDDLSKLANQAVMSALYSYSKKWGLVTPQPMRTYPFDKHPKSFYETRKYLSKQKDDLVEQKYALLIAFQAFFADPTKHQQADNVIHFIKKNFKTDKQKAALKMFTDQTISEVLNCANMKIASDHEALLTPFLT